MRKLLTIAILTVFVSAARAVDVSMSGGGGSYTWTDSDSSGLYTNGNTFGVKLRLGLTSNFGVGISYTTWKSETNTRPVIESNWTATDLTADYTFSMVPIVKPYVGAGVGNYTSSVTGGASDSSSGLLLFGGLSMKVLRNVYVDYGYDYHTIFASGKNRTMTSSHFGVSFRI